MTQSTLRSDIAQGATQIKALMARGTYAIPVSAAFAIIALDANAQNHDDTQIQTIMARTMKDIVDNSGTLSEDEVAIVALFAPYFPQDIARLEALQGARIQRSIVRSRFNIDIDAVLPEKHAAEEAAEAAKAEKSAENNNDEDDDGGFFLDFSDKEEKAPEPVVPMSVQLFGIVAKSIASHAVSAGFAYQVGPFARQLNALSEAPNDVAAIAGIIKSSRDMLIGVLPRLEACEEFKASINELDLSDDAKKNIFTALSQGRQALAEHHDISMIIAGMVIAAQCYSN